VDALFSAFQARAEAVSSEVHRFPSKAQACDFIAQFLSRESPGTTAVWAGEPWLESGGPVPIVAPQVTRDAAAAAKVGISQMDWALADTGTVVEDASAIDKRLVSTLPSIHIAIVATNSLQPDLATMLAKLHPKQASYISMITGPSRTADIERVLTIGVHGPARLIIVFVDELGSN